MDFCPTPSLYVCRNFSRPVSFDGQVREAKFMLTYSYLAVALVLIPFLQSSNGDNPHIFVRVITYFLIISMLKDNSYEEDQIRTTKCRQSYRSNNSQVPSFVDFSEESLFSELLPRGLFLFSNYSSKTKTQYVLIHHIRALLTRKIKIKEI